MEHGRHDRGLAREIRLAHTPEAIRDRPVKRYGLFVHRRRCPVKPLPSARFTR